MGNLRNLPEFKGVRGYPRVRADASLLSLMNHAHLCSSPNLCGGSSFFQDEMPRQFLLCKNVRPYTANLNFLVYGSLTGLGHGL